MKSATKTENNTPRTLDLRDRLKVLIEKELDNLPAVLDNLNDKERLDVVLKLTEACEPPTVTVPLSASAGKLALTPPVRLIVPPLRVGLTSV